MNASSAIPVPAGTGTSSSPTAAAPSAAAVGRLARKHLRHGGGYGYSPTPCDHSAILHAELGWTGPTQPGDPVLALMQREEAAR